MKITLVKAVMVKAVIALLAGGAVAAAAEPAELRYSRPESSYAGKRFDETALLKHDFVTLAAQNAAFTLHRAPRDTELYLHREQPPEEKSRFAAPSAVFARSAKGAAVLRPGTALAGSAMAAPWLLLSFAETAEAPFDAPVLFVLSKRPAEIRWDKEQGLKAVFSTPDTGWVARMLLYGFEKLPKKGVVDWRVANGLPAHPLKSWEWPERLPAAVAARCEWWARVSRAFPVGYRETFSVDRAAGGITTREDYEWLLVKDDWGTEPLRFAAIPPVLGLAHLYGMPIKFSRPVKDAEYFTMYGPVMGAEDTDRLEYTLEVGQYIDQVLEVDPGKLDDEIDRKALANIEATMKGKFDSANCWRFDHGAVNLVWALHSDQWYARALPLVGAELAERAKSAWRLYMEHYAIGPWLNGWSAMRGRWMLWGPGSNAWGGFGDSDKLGSTTLTTVWAYGYYTGDWELIKRKWDFIKGMWNTDLICADDWLCFCRHSHAEWGDIGPPSMALARMAWEVGDYDTYLYASFLAARQLVGHYATMHGGKYFREHGPYRTDEPMPVPVFPSHQHHGMGWLVNGPTYKPSTDKDPVYQWANHFVRFACPDLGRFYQEHLDEPTRRFLSEPDILNCKTMPNALELDTDTHIRPAALRIWGLATKAPRAEVCAKGPWESWRGYGSWQIAGNYAVLLAEPQNRKLTRVVPEGPASEFLVGLERAPLHAKRPWNGVAERWWWNGRSLVWGPVAFGGKEGYLSLTRIVPAARDGTVEYCGSEVLHWAGLAYWADRVAARQLSESELAELRKQFDAPWMVCGAFAVGIDDGIEAVLPPERELDFNAQYEGRDGPAVWREAQAKNGELDSEKLFGGTWRIGYHLQYVDSPEERRALLEIVHNGGCKAWLNDEDVFYTHITHHTPRADTVPAVLRKGRNKLLIKTDGMWGKWTTGCRVLAPDGKPFTDLKYSAR